MEESSLFAETPVIRCRLEGRKAEYAVSRVVGLLGIFGTPVKYSLIQKNVKDVCEWIDDANFPGVFVCGLSTSM